MLLLLPLRTQPSKSSMSIKTETEKKTKIRAPPPALRKQRGEMGLAGLLPPVSGYRAVELLCFVDCSRCALGVRLAVELPPVCAPWGVRLCACCASWRPVGHGDPPAGVYQGSHC